MRIKALLMSFIIGLFALSLMACSDYDHDNGHGHSHEPVTEQPGAQQAAPNPTTHDNLD